MEGNGSSAVTELAPWQPGDPVPGWARVLQEPFPLDEIGIRPQVWCKDCNAVKNGPKACRKKKDEPGAAGVDHIIAKCPECGQRVSKAHLHLNFVGHADATRRLLQADPRWTWRPMARDVDPETLRAAIATGNPEIVKMVIEAAPPAITEIPNANGYVERGMWMWLVVHDEHGREVVTPGFGDATGKAWGVTALKEVIGDGIRNAGMRRGLALDLWRRMDLEQARRDTAAATGSDYADRAALFDDDAKQATAAGGRRRAKPAEPKPDTGANEAGINPEAQATADMAWRIAEDPKPGGLGALQACHEKAREKRLLGLHCLDPRDRRAKITVLKVISAAREVVTAREAGEQG